MLDAALTLELMTTEQAKPLTRQRVDDQLCFATYSASRAFTAAYRRRLAPMGLTYTQFLVLLVLWEEPEVTMQEICRGLELDSGTLTPVLKRMEEANLISRRRGVDDERTVIVTLEPAGEVLMPRARQVQDEIAAATGLPDDEIDELREQLRAMTVALGEDG